MTRGNALCGSNTVCVCLKEAEASGWLASAGVFALGGCGKSLFWVKSVWPEFAKFGAILVNSGEFLFEIVDFRACNLGVAYDIRGFWREAGTSRFWRGFVLFVGTMGYADRVRACFHVKHNVNKM